MTTKQRLHELVDQLPDSETEKIARFLQELANQPMAQQLPTTAQLGGSVPDLTGEMTTAEYLRHIRGG
jgi:hypothetical protein